MKEEKNDIANKIITELCYRIERMCRYAPLDPAEVDGQSIEDRKAVEGLYIFYRKQDKSEKISERKAKADAIRLILCETFS